MKKMKNYLLLTILVLSSLVSFSQTKNTIQRKDTIIILKENLNALLIKNSEIESKSKVFFNTSKGNISLKQLKEKYLSQEIVEPEIKSIVDKLIAAEGDCYCQVCTQSCQYQQGCSMKTVPCGWCCQ